MIPCCAWESLPGESLPGVDEFFHSGFMGDLRRMMVDNDPPAQCRICVSKDEVGSLSVRRLGWEIAEQLGIDWQAEPTLVSQDVNLSNLCNIKCRSCSSILSTKWIADEKRLGTTPGGGGRHTDSGWHMTAAAADTIRKLEFCGGEPMLHQDRILDALGMVSSRGRLHEITIDITTNGMVPPSPDLLRLISGTKRAYVNVSIDGHGSLNDYIRSDSDWDTISGVVSTMDAAIGTLPNVYMGISTVLSVLNANAMEDLWVWLRQWVWNGNTHGMIICYGPEWLDARILPRGFRDMLVRRYRDLRPSYPERHDMIDAITRHLSQDVPDADALWETMLRRNSDLDALRSTDIGLCNQELAGIMRP